MRGRQRSVIHEQHRPEPIGNLRLKGAQAECGLLPVTATREKGEAGLVFLRWTHGQWLEMRCRPAHCLAASVILPLLQRAAFAQ